MNSISQSEGKNTKQQRYGQVKYAIQIFQGKRLGPEQSTTIIPCDNMTRIFSTESLNQK